MAWLSYVLSNILMAMPLALGAWFTSRWLRRPEVARILWVLVLVKLLTPPVFSVPLRAVPPTMACTLGVCGCGQHDSNQIVWRGLAWILLAGWSAGVGATGWMAWRRWAAFRRLLAHAAPASPDWQCSATRLAAELALRRPPEVLAIPGRWSPMVVPGWHRARLLLPVGLADRLDPAQRDALLLHELTHLRRGDHWVRLLELTVGLAYWWLPGIGAIGRQLRACEETSCDAAVVARLPGARRDYAKLLLDVCDFAAAEPAPMVPQATAMSAVDDLEQRLRAILHASPQTGRVWFATGVALVLACIVLPCGLRADFARPPVARAATTQENPSDSDETCLPEGNLDQPKLGTFCCPA